MATIKAGTYRFNDVLTQLTTTHPETGYNEVSLPFTYTANLGIEGYENTIFTCSTIYQEPRTEEEIDSNGVGSLQYTAVASTPDLTPLGVNYPLGGYVWNPTDGWNFNGAQTITITEDTEVSDEFYEWFKTNAKTKQFTKLNIGDTVASGGGRSIKRLSVEKAGSEGLAYTLSNDGTYYICSGIGTCTDTDLVIASEIDGVPVTSIGDRAFRNCTNLTSITIPDSVTSIGALAFGVCNKLTSISFGENSQLTSIGSHAFDGCANLTSIEIPDSVRIIGEFAFSECDNLTSISIPDSVTSIAGWVFYNCDKLTSISIPDSVTSIGEGSFYGCISLTSIIISDSVTSIGPEAYELFDSLSNVYYTGTEAEWASITIEDGNTELTNATIHYNYVQDV